MDQDKCLQNIHKYTKLHHLKKNILRERDPEPPWQAYGYVRMYINGIIFCMNIYMF